MSDANTILLTIGGIAVSALASWYFSRGTDIKAALKRLEGDTKKLIPALNTIGSIMEKKGLAVLSRDSAGNITGIAVTATVGIASSITAAAPSATYTKAEPPRYDRQHEQPDPEKSEGPDA